MSLAITSLCKLNVTNGCVKSQKMKAFVVVFFFNNEETEPRST